MDLILDSDVVLIATTFLIAFIGAVCKDWSETMSRKGKKISIPRILIGTIAATMIMVAISSKIDFLDSRLFIFLCFVSGVGGFESFAKIKDINVLNILSKFSNGLIEEKKEENKD